ncbi:hypothetical protein DOM22_03180 [Bdellovibrio sp. ZAP7]|uniref:hypothetical protein n=1 Tax=Bdellovibrio sp. ZAP7 TaxID=2231053 RepID=UPI001158A091|nr:hypothetical protein [Bdellovibrio sp. ZAP7]QDK44226.1 hypothetical protein DOM22_03180 [Bdellovibrio sp. ZAP7]
MSFLKSLRILLILMTSIAPITTFAAKTHCICQTGTEPASQIPFFKIGCKMWLSEQTSCASKEVVAVAPSNTWSPLKIENTSPGDTLRIGFVGHWENDMTAPYLGNSIIPTMRDYDVNIQLDNTACMGLQQPLKAKEIAEFEVLFPRNRTITFKANQAISVGIWNRILPLPTANFWSVLMLPSGKVVFPHCEDFENKSCVGAYQKNQYGRCVDRNARVKPLICLPYSEEKTDKRGTRTETSWRWQNFG